MPLPPDFDELRCRLALHASPGVGPRGMAILLDAWPRARDWLRGRKDPPLTRGLAAAALRRPNWAAADRALCWADAPGRTVIAPIHSAYPPLLRQIPVPPPLIFVDGAAEILSQPMLAIVGARKCSEHGARIAADFAGAASAAGLVVVSGLALGIDAAAHAGALRGGCGTPATVAVLGNGIDTVYPARHAALAARIREQGCLLSEFPLGAPPAREHFPRRNRLISGLSLGVCVIQARLRSGSLSTARHALEQNRDVFAVPGSVDNPLSSGCHSLIKQGAKLVESFADIAEEIPAHWLRVSNDPGAENSRSNACETLDRESARLLERLVDGPLSIDELVAVTGLTATRLSSMLCALELRGAVEAMPGGRYAVT